MKMLPYAVFGGLLGFVLFWQALAIPTVWHCLYTEGWWHHFTGKAHCELEGWRFVLRSLR